MNPGKSDAPVPEVQLRELAMAGRKLIPADWSEAAECHFNSVLHALRELAQSSAGKSNRPTAKKFKSTVKESTTPIDE